MATDDLILDVIKTRNSCDLREDLGYEHPDGADQQACEGGKLRPLKERLGGECLRDTPTQSSTLSTTCSSCKEGKTSCVTHYKEDKTSCSMGCTDTNSFLWEYKDKTICPTDSKEDRTSCEHTTTCRTSWHGDEGDAAASRETDTESAKSLGPGGEEDWDSDGRPTGERWPPLGAPDDDNTTSSFDSYSELSWYRGHLGRGSEGGGGGGMAAAVAAAELERLQQLEEEQEQLNNSLMALTSHFAQVQFRLKQIVDASPEEKGDLLRQLEEFANRGIPDLRECGPRGRSRILSTTSDGSESEAGGGEAGGGVARQKELIQQLKQQLEDLENYVYQTGEGGPPQAKVIEKQRVIIEQLKDKLNLNVDEMDKLTVDDLKCQVDLSIRELTNPLKMKEQLVAQLQTQITDLERFIKFLQGEGGSARVPQKGKVRPPGDGRPQDPTAAPKPPQAKRIPRSQAETEQLRQETENIMQRAATLVSMLSFGCSTSRTKFRRNTLKKTPQGSHYGDLRAGLELAINHVLEVAEASPVGEDDQTSDSEEGHHGGEEMTLAVRRHLTTALRDLMGHGLLPVGQSQSLVPFLSCLPSHSARPTTLMHPWDLILQYYHLKKGHQYNHTPARRLSESFNLDIRGGAALTNKQGLLSVVGSIISSHTPLKRSPDSHLKAFVCAALNERKLVVWLRLIFRCQSMTEHLYQPWSYLALTGFEDALRSLDRLTPLTFRLPINLAVRSFQNMRDAF